MRDENKNILDVVIKFESIIRTNESFFFDVDDFEDIILYYFNEANYSLAEKALFYALKLYPNNININILNSELLIINNQIFKADIIIDEFLIKHDNNPDLLFQKAKILNLKKEYLKSNSILIDLEYDSALEFFVTDLKLKNYMILEQYESAITIAKKIINQCPEDKMILDKLISCYKLSSNYEGAISFLNKFLDKNPYSKYAWFELGKIYFSQKKYKESKTSHEFAIICDDSFSASHVELGKVYEKMENFKRAIYYYKIVHSQKSSSPFSMYRLSRCLEKIGDYESSIKYLNEIVEIDPLYEKAWISIAKYHLRKNDHDKAIENLNMALSIISKNY